MFTQILPANFLKNNKVQVTLWTWHFEAKKQFSCKIYIIILVLFVTLKNHLYIVETWFNNLHSKILQTAAPKKL